MFGKLFPALIECSHFPNLFCTCSGSQIAFVIPQTAQSTGQKAADSELHFQCLNGNRAHTDNPESSCEFLFSVSSFIAFVTKFLNKKRWFFIFHLLPFSAIFLLLLNRETLAGLLHQKIRRPPKRNILTEEVFWRRERRGFVRVSVCLSVCLPVAGLLSQEGRGLGVGAKGGPR